MRFGMYLVMIFCFSVIAYWMGETSPFMAAWEQQGESWLSFDVVLTILIQSITTNSDIIIAMILGLGLAAFASSFMQGFSANFIVPILILIPLAAYFVLPVSMLFDVTIPIEVRLPLMFLLNMFLVLGIVDFVRGKT